MFCAIYINIENIILTFIYEQNGYDNLLVMGSKNGSKLLLLVICCLINNLFSNRYGRHIKNAGQSIKLRCSVKRYFIEYFG